VPFGPFRIEPQFQGGTESGDGEDVGVQRAVGYAAVVRLGDTAGPERALIEGQRGIQVADRELEVVDPCRGGG